MKVKKSLYDEANFLILQLREMENLLQTDAEVVDNG